jgi:hypothetical protein
MVAAVVPFACQGSSLLAHLLGPSARPAPDKPPQRVGPPPNQIAVSQEDVWAYDILRHALHAWLE